ncbi:unnamed protein product [Cuscuta epithymum]|uniref:Uncharacterized protein n=1 Tax=Cuscuta epithymum TaxID=186058 RepID=A0AAV0FJS9_9ASTE|nr:unnamed protein product [Cuscuta epithymum]
MASTFLLNLATGEDDSHFNCRAGHIKQHIYNLLYLMMKLELGRLRSRRRRLPTRDGAVLSEGCQCRSEVVLLDWRQHQRDSLESKLGGHGGSGRHRRKWRWWAASLYTVVFCGVAERHSPQRLCTVQVETWCWGPAFPRWVTML